MDSTEENNPEQLLILPSDLPSSNLKLTGDIPSPRQISRLMKIIGLHRNIVKHQLAVMREARDIAYNIKKILVDIELVKSGALLHDIGRIKDHSFLHGPIGGDIIRYYGFSEKLARIAERHTMAGLSSEEAENFSLPDRIYEPDTIEEKIVCLADKYYIGVKKVTIRERFQKWIQKYGETPFLKQQLKKALKLEEEILQLIF